MWLSSTSIGAVGDPIADDVSVALGYDQAVGAQEPQRLGGLGGCDANGEGEGPRR